MLIEDQLQSLARDSWKSLYCEYSVVGPLIWPYLPELQMPSVDGANSCNRPYVHIN